MHSPMITTAICPFAEKAIAVENPAKIAAEIFCVFMKLTNCQIAKAMKPVRTASVRTSCADRMMVCAERKISAAQWLRFSFR